MTNDSARHLQRWEDTMAKYHGQLEFFIYAAEIHCPTPNRGSICHHKEHGCPFKALVWTGTDLHVCRLRGMRTLIGDHVKQDDAVRE